MVFRGGKSMSSSGVLHNKNFFQKVGILIRYLHTATSPDARWGAVQVLLSFFFFFFGLAIAAISIYDTSFGGKPAMIAAISWLKNPNRRTR